MQDRHARGVFAALRLVSPSEAVQIIPLGEPVEFLEWDLQKAMGFLAHLVRRPDVQRAGQMIRAFVARLSASLRFQQLLLAPIAPEPAPVVAPITSDGPAPCHAPPRPARRRSPIPVTSSACRAAA